jgi:hypothetical protein
MIHRWTPSVLVLFSACLATSCTLPVPTRVEKLVDAESEFSVDALDDNSADIAIDTSSEVTQPLDVVTPRVMPDDLCLTTPTVFLSASVGRHVYEGTTDAPGLGRNYVSSCSRSDTGSSEDVVYALRLNRPQRVLFVLESLEDSYDPVLYITQDCMPIVDGTKGVFEHEIACMNDRAAGDRNPRFSVVLPRGDYRVVVDGANSHGRYRLTTDLSEPETPAAIEVIDTGACVSPMVGSFGNLNLRSDDQNSSEQMIPFPFVWYGMSYTQLVANTNGFVRLVPSQGRASDWLNQALPSTSASDAMLAVWWDDLLMDTTPGSDIRVGVAGTAPNRAYVIQWFEASRYGENTARYTFEVRLMETSNVVEFHYCSMNFAMSTNARTSASIGVASSNGTRGATYLLNADPGPIQGRILRFRAIAP